MSSPVAGAAAGAAICAGVCLAAAPYLARLVLTVPDRERAEWWRGERASAHRTVATASIAVIVGGFAGAAAGISVLLPAFALLALVCVPLVVIDYEHHRLPNRLLLPLAGGAALLLGAAAAARAEWYPLLHAAEGAAAVFAVLFLFALISPRGFGLGDVKLGGILGGYLGWFGWADVYLGIFAGFVLGAVVAVAGLVSRRATMTTAIPFGPTLILGPLLVLALDLVPSFGA